MEDIIDQRLFVAQRVRLVSHIFESVGLLSVFNSSLSEGSVLDYFRTTCVQPQIQTPGPGPALPVNYTLKQEDSEESVL